MKKGYPVSYNESVVTANECLLAINTSWKKKFVNPMIEIGIALDRAICMVSLEVFRGNLHLFSNKQLEVLRCADYQLHKIGYVAGSPEHACCNCENKNCYKSEMECV